MAGKQSKELSELIAEAAKKGMARDSFFSFGDEGLTASVSATGRLLRITQHFPGQKTGLCIDDKGMSEPYYVSSRLEEFLERSRDEKVGGIGPRIDSLWPGSESDHDIVNDRWPTFTRTMRGKTLNKLRVSYVAFQGTIYQKFEIIHPNETQSSQSESKEFPSDILPTLSLELEVFIRDLDFVTWGNLFNKASSQPQVPVYTTFHGQAKNHVTQEHKSPETPGKHFVLHVQVLDQHNTMELFKPDQENIYHTTPSDGNDPDRQAVLVVLAYTLKQCTASSDSDPLPDWERFIEADKLLHHYDTVSLTKNDTLDFFLRRNLEYILSVCSIPVSEAYSDGIPAIALTCGDVDGHRVSNAASFYAFQFLLLGLDHFKFLHSELPDGICDCDKWPLFSTASSYVCMMKRRIERVCKGHMNWVFQRAALSKNPFCPNYWTSGDEIEDWEDNFWLPRKSLVEAPFQFIKAADFYKRIDGEMPEDHFQAARAAYNSWIRLLEKIEKSGKCAFPSYKDSDDGKPIKTFYLTDHALIWQAVRSAESMKLHSSPKDDPELIEKMRGYSADKLRENIVKRFTTENSLLKQRMIAVKRSPTQTRFLFRSKDVALFRAMGEGLFEQAEIQWMNTLDSQKHHEGNDDTDWSDPRRFSLAISMARHGKLINFRTRKELTEQALSILLSTSSSNGLFAGALDERQSSAIYEDERDRDNYWTVVFEVPYILWKDYCSLPSSDPEDDTNRKSKSTDSCLEHMCQSVERISKHLGDLTVHPTETTGPRYRYGYWMKHNLPFNNVIDDNNVVELQDEWLYNEPDFFVKTTAMTNVDRGDRSGADTNTETSMSAKAIYAYVQLKIDIKEPKPFKEKRPLSIFPVDYYSQNAENSFEEDIKSQRETQDAKKRFWAFISTNAEENSSCTKTLAPNEKREQAEMEHFFDRHKTNSNFFTEETIAALNIWTTEFQMAFYSGVKDGEFWGGNEIEKVAMGFRFEGDFFDKYWTCRFVVANPHLPAEEYEVQTGMIKLLQQDHEDDYVHSSIVKKGPWEQRRVLELILFGHIISEMATSARHILELAERTVRKQKNKLEQRLQRLQGSEMFKQERDVPSPEDGGPIDYNSFIITSNEFRKFQERLQMIHGDFAKARPISDHWLNREKDRQAEQPRWTFSDESRYRPVLNKLLVTNRRAIQDLDRNLRGISTLSESITKELEYVSSGLESISNEESRQNNKDVKLFTYTTAVFLPLGFATGMFSMSGTPDAQTVGGMFGLFVGVFILGLLIILSVAKVNAKYGNSRQIREKLMRWGRQKIDRPSLLGTLIILILIVGKVNAKELTRRGRQKINEASLGRGREASAEGKSTEETNAERKEDDTDKRPRRRFCGLKLYRKEKDDALAKHREGHVEEGRGGLSFPRVDETATSGSA
ncbi:hypothetical protein CABS01_14682 [Colletotrichum abscissum]|uniref:Mg2+ transporter zinc transport protein n=1 Tax=Colletotrichum abscissum TaxID=1671311 RepID=A0A9Q0B2L4_9PEZI|nr:uncharacterized protein CABS01_14682 [Colletotrichum abscissum]KAI3546501.1 hypothetical protein CABS02_09043 [Colletotrichum abscissum]KAK1478998.1 hypothetical protein CABS01_14682 [Colletotrichum abscissum]